jgi:hypothetical protein
LSTTDIVEGEQLQPTGTSFLVGASLVSCLTSKHCDTSTHQFSLKSVLVERVAFVLAESDLKIARIHTFVALTVVTALEF